MPESAFDAPVAVTGASGYVASWVVRELLARGATVHGTVRDPSREDRVAHLTRLADELPGTLRLFAADLLEDGAFDEAIAGCGVVLHTASPFQLSVKDPQRDLVEPALHGTRNVLGSVERSESVGRVVLTSSVVSVIGDYADAADGRVDESDWNTTSSTGHQPYSYSKTAAEREAWKIAEGQDRWKLVTINPGFVLGPSLAPRVDSTSIDFVVKLLDGTRRSGMPHMYTPYVDVREIAAAHVEAAIRPDAEGRHILAAGTMAYMEAAGVLREAFPDRPLPRRTLPNPLAYVIGPILVGWTWRYLRANLGIRVEFDNTRSRERLGIDYRPLADTLRDHAQQLIDDGLVA